MKELAEAIDRLVEAGGALVTETVDITVVSQLSAANADALTALCAELDWTIELYDRAGELLERNQATHEEFSPYRFHLKKPPAAPGVLRLLTRAGLRRALQEGQPAPVWAILGFTARISCGLRVLQGWDESTPPAEIPATKSPRKLVREYGQVRQVPSDVRLWLSAELDEATYIQPAAQAWVSAATSALTACLPNEIDADDGRLKFRGPPRFELTAYDCADQPLDRGTFNVVLRAIEWVFESDREAELRHTLLAGELARSGPLQEGTTQFLQAHLGHALESAHIAYQMALSETARDTLKILGELRKTVTDETAKLAEMSRQLTGAVSAAVATGIGLIAARVAANAPAVLIVSVVAVVLIYIAMIISSGIRFMQLQRTLRAEWQHRLYRFLPRSEYATLVTAPTGRAEASFRMTAWLGGSAVAVLSVACLWVAVSTPNAAAVTEGPATTPPQSVSSQARKVPLPSPAGPTSRPTAATAMPACPSGQAACNQASTAGPVPASSEVPPSAPVTK
ncbi:hypothetical protein DBR34_02970 [Stenotrophomonas sp. HMWF003]|nr:hypothetical protein DBR34_02970 [Stenotrophomonas sp. HMWF003]